MLDKLLTLRLLQRHKKESGQESPNVSILRPERQKIILLIFLKHRIQTKQKLILELCFIRHEKSDPRNAGQRPERTYRFKDPDATSILLNIKTT